MKVFIAAAAVFVICVANTFTRAENCDKHGILVYEDMACRPTYDSGKPCPTKYDCEGLRQSNNHCFFRGHTYNHGDGVENSPPCRWGCICRTGLNSSDFSCPQFGCQNWGRQPEPGCYWTFNLDKCCASGQKCPTPNEEVVKCVVDGVEYKEGEIFSPKDSCTNCICKEGYKGKYEAPYCKRAAECGVQLYNQFKTQAKCAPAYAKNTGREAGVLCCPNKWICPDGTEEIKPNTVPDPHGPQCHFGETTLQIGQSFEKEITKYGRTDKFKCNCKIPPLLTCVEI